MHAKKKKYIYIYIYIYIRKIIKITVLGTYNNKNSIHFIQIIYFHN
ncbi:hypothetical protein K6L59_03385 [Candidatus Phytoplasma sp. Tabriz.2]|nr:hypothetical protein [Candidatus Phytoplasma australiense]